MALVHEGIYIAAHNRLLPPALVDGSCVQFMKPYLWIFEVGFEVRVPGLCGQGSMVEEVVVLATVVSSAMSLTVLVVALELIATETAELFDHSSFSEYKLFIL